MRIKPYLHISAASSVSFQRCFHPPRMAKLCPKVWFFFIWQKWIFWAQLLIGAPPKSKRQPPREALQHADGMWYPASLCCLFLIHCPHFKVLGKWYGELCRVRGLLTSSLHLIPHLVTNHNFDPPCCQQCFGYQQQRSQDSCCQQHRTTRDGGSAVSPACSHRVMMGSIERHKKPIPGESSAPQWQHSLSSQSRPTGGRCAACEPARKTKPSLHLILGLAALRMFWAIFIFAFSNSSTFKVIPLKAVVLPLAPGFFPSPQKPGQRVQQCESPDLPEKALLSGSRQDTEPSKDFPTCPHRWDREETILRTLSHHQLAARLSE